jgi:hypothetical protein
VYLLFLHLKVGHCSICKNSISTHPMVIKEKEDVSAKDG